MRVAVVRILIVVVMFTLCSACQTSIPVVHSTIDRTVAAGKILDLRAMEWVTSQELVYRLAQAKTILLGERHDNQLHHQLQAQLISDIAAVYPDSSVSFEMIDQEQARIIGDMNQLPLERLIEQLESTSGAWDYSNVYKPVLAAALHNQLRIYPANIELEKLRAFMKQEQVALDDDIEYWLQQVQLDDEQQASLNEELINSHCGMLDSQSAAPMVDVQRARDVAMSVSLFNSTAERRFLIAGAGHVRTDRGVPYYLQTISPELSIAALAFIEADPEHTELDYYEQRWGSESLPFHYVWFTEGLDRADPCDSFRLKE